MMGSCPPYAIVLTITYMCHAIGWKTFPAKGRYSTALAALRSVEENSGGRSPAQYGFKSYVGGGGNTAEYEKKNRQKTSQE